MQSVSAKPGFTSLFNGKDLTGWVGDPDLWKVEDSILVGRTTKNLSYNDFLRTEKNTPISHLLVKHGCGI